MSKESFYFPHDFEPTSDPKMQAFIGEYGAVGYGVYWRFIEMMHSDESHKLPFKQYVFIAIAKQMQTSAEQIEAMIKYCIYVAELFVSDGDLFWSDRVMRNFFKRAELSEKRRVAGRAGAIAKQNLANISKVKKSKVKEIGIIDDTPKNIDVVSPPAKPKTTVCDFYKEQIKISNDDPEYKKFVSFLYGKSEKNQERCVNILSLRDQLKYYQFKKLLTLWNEKLNKKSLHEIVLDLENFKQAGKKYCSVGKTLTNWIKSDQQFAK